jgi:hypothetical protein
MVNEALADPLAKTAIRLEPVAAFIALIWKTFVQATP